MNEDETKVEETQPAAPEQEAATGEAGETPAEPQNGTEPEAAA